MNAKLVTVKELADIVQVHVKTVKKWVRCGIIPAVRPTKRTMRFDLDKCLAVLNR